MQTDGMRTKRLPDGEYANLIVCDLCHEEFRFGQHRYAGRKIVEWGLVICEMCESMNHDGLVPQMHPELMERLAKEGVKLDRLPGGFIRIPQRGH